MAEEFEFIFSAMLVVTFAVCCYLAGKGNILELVPKMLLARLEELNQKHGEWIEEIIPLDWCEDDVDISYKCSECGCNNFGESNYCPNCGAKMDGKENGK